MKHLFFYFLLSLAIAPKLGAQDSTQVAKPNFIPVLAYWNLNDTFFYNVQKTDVKYTDEGLVQDSTAEEYEMQLVVVDSTDTTYVIRVHRTFKVEDLAVTLEMLNLDQSDLTKICRIMGSENLEYVINQNGEFLEAKNADGLGKGLAFVLQKALTNLDTFSEQRNKRIQEFGAKYASSELAQSKIMEDFMLMHKFYGLWMVQDHFVEFEEKIQSPFAPDKPMIYHYKAMATVPENWEGWFRIESQVTIDSASLKGYLDTFYAQLKREESSPEPQRETMRTYPTFEIYASYAMNPNSGKVGYVYMEQPFYLNNKLARQKTMLINSVD